MDLKEKIKQELAFRKARTDIKWTASHWWIQHPQGSRPWELYPAQEEILDLWASGENAIHLKARQLGFSTSVGFYAFWRAYFNPDLKILLISKGERESAELLDKVKFGLDRLPEWMRHRGPKTTAWTQSRIAFDNGSEILSLPSANNPARGFTGALIVVDEWAFLLNGEEAWASIEPTADIGGQIIGLSTANGINNIFYTLWQMAMTTEDSMFTAVFYPWGAVPGRDEAWYKRKAKNMLPWQLHQEYPTDPEEAFIRSGASVFDISDIRKMATSEPTRYRLELAGTPGVRLAHNPDGEVRIWEKPIEKRMYVMGVDVAEGLGHGDFSSVHIIDVVTRQLVAAWHGRIPADLFAEQVHGLGTLYNSALAGVEVNNHGLTTITVLRQLRYPRLWRRRAMNDVNNKMSVEFGFKTSRTTKPPLIDGLGAWMREEKDGERHEMRDAALAKELMTFVRADNGTMGGSPHDDRVISMALAVKMLDFAHQPEYELEIDDTGTFAWWVRMTDEVNEPLRRKGGIRTLRSTRV